MAKLVRDWDEDDILSLPPGENDTFERKSTDLSAKPDAALPELAKQLSAFANAGGGQIIYGVDDSGKVANSGITRVIRGRQPTKEWLEDVLPTLTDYEVVGCNVYEILPKSNGSAVAPDKSLYVVDVPDSDRAPHQSTKDYKYYVRMGSHSLPARHRIIEDIRNRARHPRIEVVNCRINSAQYTPLTAGMDSLTLILNATIRNAGRVLAAHVALLVGSNVQLAIPQFDQRETRTRTSAVPGTGIIELNDPLYPGMGVPVGTVLTVGALVMRPANSRAGYLLFGDVGEQDVVLTITAFADSAPAQEHNFKLKDIDVDGLLRQATQQELLRRYKVPYS